PRACGDNPCAVAARPRPVTVRPPFRGTLPVAMKTGLERVLSGDSKALAGKRLGLLVNPTAVDTRVRHIVDLLHAAKDANLVCLFGPEHGVRGDAQDMDAVTEAKDSITGLPMYSLYGSSEESLHPKPEMLKGLDAVVFDIQDIGSRY